MVDGIKYRTDKPQFGRGRKDFLNCWHQPIQCKGVESHEGQGVAHTVAAGQHCQHNQQQATKGNPFEGNTRQLADDIDCHQMLTMQL